MAASCAETDVAVVGMAGRWPGADDVGELWRNLRDGVEAVRALADAELLAAGVAPRELAHPDLVKRIAMPRGIDRFDAGFFGFSHREAEVMDPQQRLLLECAWQALEDAGYVGEDYPGPIGVFAGVSTSTYLLYQVMANAAAVAALDQLLIDLGNSGDYLTTRISHKLNLTGPSYLIQSACSTSLVAVHAACQSLLAEECDMALAGGASINVRQLRGYWYQRGGIVSPDGSCRSFDARAGGSVVGSGLGLVVLKRLADAVADGDTIRAVIKGSAVNNDGAHKVGYTAPSVEGQAQVIAEALARSGVAAEDISYVEAHGSGTALGDPIEVLALTRAFGLEGRRGTCALGSVKTNVGHLATASGVTGLIKTVLSLEHRMLPPSLHFERPNPEIDFASSPFYVNAKLTPWEGNGGGPRRAGVSAFGFGGTNAHVVVEEAPAVAGAAAGAGATAAASPRPSQLLLLSAKSPAALAEMTANLGAHLRDRAELELADVAYTLQRGRKRFGQRRAVICRGREEAVRLLADPTAEGVLSGVAEAGDTGAGVAFLFPGLGDQRLHMGRGLYEAEASFRAAVDRSCELLAGPLGVDLREILYPAQAAPESGDGAPAVDLRRLLGRGAEKKVDEAARRLDRTVYAQPAVFVVEHALARLWMDWGVQPRALIGYSLGEYTAACIAGVLGLEEALWLVAERARLIEELPPGAMLAAPLSESAMLPRLGPDLCLAAINTPQMCVVAGTEEAVGGLEAELGREGIASRRLRTTHAFHSRLMEPVAEKLAELLRQVHLRAPKIPYLSNVTGTWITAREATDPLYWARHLCQPVRFSAGLGELLRQPGRKLVEVGPGQVLSTFVRQQAAAPAVSAGPSANAAAQASSGALAVPSLGERGASEEHATLMRALGRLWLAGIEIDGERFFRDERRRRVPLPTYPFERQRYWIEAAPLAELQGEPLVEPPPETESAAAVAIPVEAVAAPSAKTLETLAVAAPAVPEALAGTLSQHPRPALGNAYVAPRDEMERTVAGMWQRLLGVDLVGINDDFFELGGHSFLATRLVGELRDALGLEVGMATLFDKPTIAGFAAAVTVEQMRQQENATPAATLQQIVPDTAGRYERFALTDVQQAYLIGRGGDFALGHVSTHVYAEIDARGLDVARLTQAFRFVVERHDMLRAVVYPDATQQVLQTVPPFAVATLDLRGQPAGESAAALAAIRERMSHQVLPCDQWPMYELRASLLDGDTVRLHFSFDFLVGDASSTPILLRDLGLAYRGRQSELAPLTASFRDYVLALARIEESPAFQKALAYWTARAADFPPAPDLPLAANPEAIRKPTFQRYSGRVESAAWERLKERASRHGLTSSGVTLAAFAEVLTVWAKSPRFTINLTLFNRLPIHPELNDMLGDFTSLTLLAIDNSRQAPFGERAKQAQRQLFSDLDHRQVSGVRVMRELARRRGPAIMPVVFTSILNLVPQGATPLEQLGVESVPVYTISQTPQVWIDHQVYEDPNGLVFSWDVVEELFPPGLIADMCVAFQRLLERLADDDAVWREARPVLPPDEQLQLFAAANATAWPLPESLLHAAFLARAAEAPKQPAVIAADLTLSYGELARRANALAHRLRELGARPGALVAIVMEKGWEQVTGALAVLISGAAYLPIDPELPRERRFYLFDNGGVELALTQRHLQKGLEWPATVRPLAVPRKAPAARDARPLPAVQRPHDLAYVIYTSGSTGHPKGVMIDHRGAWNTVADVNERFAVGPRDRVLALSSLSFDLSVYDLFGLLAAGGAVVIPQADRARDPEHWIELIAAHQVTLWNTVPAFMEMLADFAAAERGYRAPSLRLVLLSGDWIPLRLPERIRQLAPGVETVSLGGATEASIWSILYPIAEIGAGWHSVPYGRAMRNQSFHVLDQGLTPRPVWVPGALYIGGVGLAQGYWSDPVKTAQSFVAGPGAAGGAAGSAGGDGAAGSAAGAGAVGGAGSGGARLYRTGDLGRFLPDGNIEFLGREDFQVKIGGFRIELGEIEAALARHPAIREALVLARTPAAGAGAAGRPAGAPAGLHSVEVAGTAASPGSKRLTAYFTTAPGAAPSAAELRELLGELLPAYMVPADFVPLESFPLTANGKVDRQALPDPQPVAAESHAAPGSPVEDILAGCFAEVLKLDRVGAGDDFFELGGNSLLAAQVMSRLRACFAVELPLRTVFEEPTPRGLARRIEQQMSAAGGAAAAAPPILAVSRPPELPLSFAQEWIWFVEQLERAGSLYVVPHALRLLGTLRVEALTAALREVVRRHEVLRTRFVAAGGRPLQVIDPGWRPDLPVLDLAGLPGEMRMPELARRLAGGAAVSFDLARGPLLRCTLVRLTADDWVLGFVLHHIISDGWSTAILVRELSTLYAAAIGAGGGDGERAAVLPELTLQYADFALWQRRWLGGDVLEGYLRQAAQRLAGISPLELPGDRQPIGEGQICDAGIAPIALPAQLAAGLRALARRQAASLFMVLLAGLEILLRRHSDRDDFAIGSPTANRNRPEIEPLIGCFINTLVFRAETAGDPTVAELLARLRVTTLEVYEHQDLPYARLVEALRPDRRQRPAQLVSVMFLFQNQPPPALAIPGLELGELRHREEKDARTHFALVLDLVDAGGKVTGALSYNRELLDPATAARWTGHLSALLAAAAEDPERRIGELPLLSAGERHQVMIEWGEDGEVVLLGGEPAPIGVWGETHRRLPGRGVPAPRQPQGASPPGGRRSRRRVDGSIELAAPAAAAASQPRLAGAAGDATAGAAAVVEAVAEQLEDQARRLEKLSAAKRKLLDKLLRGEAPAGAGPAPAGAAGAAGATPAADPALLVRLQPGAAGQPAFFAVHATGGTVHSYVELARCLGPRQPFYGIQDAGLAPGARRREAPAGLPAMAAAYAAAVEAAMPHGPLLLGGWSFGGVVAFEMARQLRERGREVSLLALLDSWPVQPDALPEQLGDAALLRLFLRDQAGLQAAATAWLDEEPPPAGEEAAVTWLLDRAFQAGLLKASLRVEQVKPLLAVTRANLQAVVAYRPQPYAGRITLFRPPLSPDPTNGWQAITGAPVEVHEMAAGHYEMLAPPAVEALAERLARCIECALGAAPQDAATMPGIALAQPRNGGSALL